MAVKLQSRPDARSAQSDTVNARRKPTDSPESTLRVARRRESMATLATTPAVAATEWPHGRVAATPCSRCNDAARIRSLAQSRLAAPDQQSSSPSQLSSRAQLERTCPACVLRRASASLQSHVPLESCRRALSASFCQWLQCSRAQEAGTQGAEAGKETEDGRGGCMCNPV